VEAAAALAVVVPAAFCIQPQD
jgi:hypothetical protein